jgi:hypothetical protein
MKYMQDGGFQNNSLMRLTLALTLTLLVGFWITNAAMYFTRMDLRPSSVVSYYNGSEEDFRPARSAGQLLEASHMHLPMMGMVILFLTHLLIFVPMGRSAKVTFIVTAFASALLQEGSGWLVRFVSPACAPLKVLGFLGLQGALAFLLLRLGWFIAVGRRVRGASAEPAPAEASRVALSVGS